MKGIRVVHVAAALGALMLVSVPASAQVDLTGVWASRLHEDYIDRGPGSEQQLLHRDELVWVHLPQSHPEVQLASVIALTLGAVWLNVQFSNWNNSFYNTLQNHDLPGFWRQLGVFGLLARRRRNLFVWFPLIQFAVILAVTEDREAATSIGINAQRVYLVTFIIGATLAALGGALASPTTALVPGMGTEMIVLSFAVAATAGLGQIEGTAITALAIGLARAFVIYTYPEFEVLVPYLIMVIVLLVRPEGLFGATKVRKI